MPDMWGISFEECKVMEDDKCIIFLLLTEYSLSASSGRFQKDEAK